MNTSVWVDQGVCEWARLKERRVYSNCFSHSDGNVLFRESRSYSFTGIQRHVWGSFAVEKRM